MTLICAFLFSGLCCLIGEILLDYLKLTPGHVTSLFTILGALLGLLNWYPKLIEASGGGATIIISNFGYLLYSGAILGYQENGILGLFSGLLTKTSTALASAVIFAFIFTILFRPKD